MVIDFWCGTAVGSCRIFVRICVFAQTAVGANTVRPSLFAYKVCINSNLAAPRNGTSGAPSPTFGDLPIHGCEAERATQGRPYAKVLLSQNRFARCFLCFALASFSVRLCHSSFLTPHLAPLFALFTIICYNKCNCDKIRKDL